MAVVDSGDPEGEQDVPQGGPCKWGPFKPSCFQRFRNPKWVLFWLCWISTLQGLVVNGFVNVIVTTIEKRFAISSTDTGTIVSCYDIASAICLLPVTYFGGMGVKPRYIGIGVFAMALGTVLFCLPHFTTGLYEVDTTQDLLCNSQRNSTCSTTVSSSVSSYKYLFSVAMLLIGAGASPFYTLGYTYLDDSLPSTSSSLYIGIYNAFAIVGAAIGYLVGGEFLNIWTDFDSVDTTSVTITTDNRRWVGAWWLGFVLASVLSFLVAIPISGFPKVLPGARKSDGQKVSISTVESNGVHSTDQNTAKTPANERSAFKSFKQSLKNVLPAVKVLVTNKSFMCINIVAAMEAMVVAGFATFTPKFLEIQFSQPSARAAQYVGYAAIPAGAGGTILGSYLIKRFNPRVPTILKWSLASCVLVILLMLTFLITCSNVSFAGVNTQYRNDSSGSSTFLGKQLSNQCNANCGCQEEDYHPVCGRDGVMYFSPCYAGCRNLFGASETLYANCSCIVSDSTDYMAEFTSCDSQCGMLPVFLPLFAVIMVFTFIISMPLISVTLRCVPEHVRSFALGIQFLFLRCLGSIPGPIIFGRVIDLACLLWQKRCDGEGSCFFYDNRKLSLYLMALGISIKFVSAIFFFLANLFYKEPKTNKIEDIIVPGPESSEAIRETTQDDPHKRREVKEDRNRIPSDPSKEMSQEDDEFSSKYKFGKLPKLTAGNDVIGAGIEEEEIKAKKKKKKKKRRKVHPEDAEETKAEDIIESGGTNDKEGEFPKE